MIRGGYILQPRCIKKSDISYAPPVVREVWAYLLREANSRKIEYRGQVVERGQLFRNYEEIREALSWRVGWRKEAYTPDQIKKAMKTLRDTLRITTRKAPAGVLITVCNYDIYQNPKNYESTTEGTTEGTNAALPLTRKNNKENIYSDFGRFWNDFHDITGKPKTDKEAAVKHWKRLTQLEQTKAIEAIKPYFQSLKDPEYCKKARTYLSDKNFNDEFKPQRKLTTSYPLI